MIDLTAAEHWEQAAITAAQKRWQAERETEKWRSRAERAETALREIHEFHCGCDRPGNPSSCVAVPTEEFAMLARREARDE